MRSGLWFLKLQLVASSRDSTREKSWLCSASSLALSKAILVTWAGLSLATVGLIC